MISSTDYIHIFIPVASFIYNNKLHSKCVCVCVGSRGVEGGRGGGGGGGGACIYGCPRAPNTHATPRHWVLGARGLNALMALPLCIWQNTDTWIRGERLAKSGGGSRISGERGGGGGE